MMAAGYFSGVKAVGGVIAAQGLASLEQFEQTLAQARQDIASPNYAVSSLSFLPSGSVCAKPAVHAPFQGAPKVSGPGVLVGMPSPARMPGYAHGVARH
jgi:hypothetical protein